MLRLGVWMVKLVNEAISDVISVIQKSDDYQKCVELKQKMAHNKELMKVIEELKKAQQVYIKNGSVDKSVVDSLKEKLYEFPIYVVYMQHLEKVNEMISYVEDDLNDFFTRLSN